MDLFEWSSAKASNDALARFEELFIPEPNSGCWVWLGATTKPVPFGYGQFWFDGKLMGAHRFAYETFVGSIPDTLDIDHLCRNRLCVNPSHLQPVTRKENMRRSPISNGNKTHCPKGHPYTPENTRLRLHKLSGKWKRDC